MILFLLLLIEKFSRWKSGKELAQRIRRKAIEKQETTFMESIGCHYSLEINYDNVNFTSSQVSELFPAAIMSVVLLKVLNDGPELNMKFALCYNTMTILQSCGD